MEAIIKNLNGQSETSRTNAGGQSEDQTNRPRPLPAPMDRLNGLKVCRHTLVLQIVFCYLFLSDSNAETWGRELVLPYLT